jgi:polyribonucleotide nucleotidyltransferase
MVTKMNPINETIKLGDCLLEIETGLIARQADAAVVVRQGETVVLSTVVASKHDSSPHDFLPLTVDFRELFGAAGVIPHAYGKREGR